MKMRVILVLACATLISAKDDLPQAKVDRFKTFLKLFLQYCNFFIFKIKKFIVANFDTGRYPGPTKTELEMATCNSIDIST